MGVCGGVGWGRAGSLVPGLSRVRTGLTTLRGTGRTRNTERNRAQVKGGGGDSDWGVMGLKIAPVGRHHPAGKGAAVLKSRLASQAGASAPLFLPVGLPGAP